MTVWDALFLIQEAIANNLWATVLIIVIGLVIYCSDQLVVKSCKTYEVDSAGLAKYCREAKEREKWRKTFE